MMELEKMGKLACTAKYEVQKLSTEEKNTALQVVAKQLIKEQSEILTANEEDLKRGRENGMPQGLLDRLLLTPERIKAMAEGLKEVSLLPDPVNQILEQFERPNGLKIQKRSVPLGVIGIIYESRPNVTADAFGLCFKAGNAVILKGGSDAISSNTAVALAIQNGLKQCGIDENAIQLITDTNRETTQAFMKLNEYVDVLIPRGGAGLIRAVVTSSTIPVIETGTGNCHIYVDREADLEKAIPIIINAKTQRIGVCNACESLVVHKDIREKFLPKLAKALQEKEVEIRGDELTRAVISDCVPATEDDFSKEYLDLIISIKTVNNVSEAIAHINAHNTHHSESIITENKETAEQFLEEVDAACVYVNASTRFTDGYEFGFGAEIGISTQKLHARGPMGLRELTSYKYRIVGDGQIRP